MKKRILATVLSLTLLLGAMVPMALAEGEHTGPTITVTASETSVSAGGTVTFTISMSAVTELNTLELHVYPSDGLTVDASASGANSESALAGAGALTSLDFVYGEEYCKIMGAVISGTAAPVTTTGEEVLATMVCHVDEGYTGTVTLDVEVVDLYCGQLGSDEAVMDSTTVVKANTVTVSIPVSGVTLDPSALSLEEGSSAQLTCTVTPAEAAGAVSFTSSDTSVATVSASGLVTAVAPGTATITATAGGLSAACEVTVTHVHAYGDAWVSDGTNHWHECSCGAQTDVAAHSGGSATCAELAVCDVCGASYGSYADHTLERHEGVEPTCTAEGNIVYYTCSVCGKVFRDAAGSDEITMDDTVVGMIDHVPGEMVADEDGHSQSCLACGNVILAGAHEYEWVVDAEATEETAGVAHQACVVCGYAIDEGTEIPVLEHMGSAAVYCEEIAPTCTEDGTAAHYCCASCGRLYSDADGENEITEEDLVIPALGHDLIQKEDENGEVYWECAVCGLLFADEDGTIPYEPAENGDGGDVTGAAGEDAAPAQSGGIKTADQNFTEICLSVMLIAAAGIAVLAVIFRKRRA